MTSCYGAGKDAGAIMIITLYLLFCMLAVLWFDTTRYIIPNWLNASLLVLYPVAVYLAPTSVDWQHALLGTAIVFAVGYLIFAKGWMGGGDVKLIVVCSLWVGWAGLLDFVVLFAILGGVLSVALYAGRKAMPYLKLQKLPRILQDKQPVPYGIAIALAFLLMMKMGKIPVIGMPIL